MVELRKIEKYFPANGVTALEDANFSLKAGEIHALLGENGAGKSTLMHILGGYLRPGAGSVAVNGIEARFSSPRDALAARIGMVRQHPSLIEGFRVWEDCVTGAEPCRACFLSAGRARVQVAALSERWGFDLDVNARTAGLTVSQRQKAAVLALLLRNVTYLIFDEPTAVLSPAETEKLFDLFKSLRDEGKGVALISHKLDETLGIADRVTILRKGRTVCEREAASLSAGELRSLMFGHGEGGLADAPAEARQAGRAKPGGTVFRVEDLRVEIPGRPFIRGLNLELDRGKILGVAGVRDSGLETLELAVTGLLRPAAGRITLGGRDITGGGIRAFREAGGGYLGAGRTGSAYAPALPLENSLIIHAHRRAKRGFAGALGILDQRFLDSWTAELMTRAGVRSQAKARADSFSGGMLQRLVLAREFAEDTRLMVAAEPGWGLDGPARTGLAERLRKYADAGGAILLFSTDVEELLAAADEIAVLRNGELGGRMRPFPAIREWIGRAMVGGGEQA